MGAAQSPRGGGVESNEEGAQAVRKNNKSEEEPGGDNTRESRRMILRIICFAMLLNATFMSLRVIVSLDALADGGAPSDVGLLMALLCFFPVFLAIPCGRWIDRMGYNRPVLLTAGLFMTASALPVIFSDPRFGLWPLYAGCVANGLGSMILAISSNYLVGAAASGGNRTQMFAWLTMGNSVAGLSSPIIAGHLIDAWGFSAAYAVSGAFSLTGLIVYLFTSWALSRIKLPPPRKFARHSTDLLKDPVMGRILIVSAVVSMAWDLETFMFPVYGHDAGLTASEIGWLVGTFYAATFLVRFAQSWLSRIFSDWHCLTFCLVVSGLCYILFPNFNTMTPLLAIAFVLGLGLGVANPSILSLLQSHAPAGRAAEAFGIRSTLANLTHFSLPLAYGTILAALSVATLFYACAGLILATVGLTVTVREKAQADSSE